MFHRCGNTAEISHSQMFCIECRELAPPPMQYLAKLYGVVEHKRRRREILDELTALYRREYEARFKEVEEQVFVRGNGFVAKLIPRMSVILFKDVSHVCWRMLTRRECAEVWGEERRDSAL